MDQVPVIRLAHLTREQVDAYRIRDNHLIELGEWDHRKLSAELEALQAVDFDLELTGRGILLNGPPPGAGWGPWGIL